MVVEPRGLNRTGADGSHGLQTDGLTGLTAVVGPKQPGWVKRVSHGVGLRCPVAPAWPAAPGAAAGLGWASSGQTGWGQTGLGQMGVGG